MGLIARQSSVITYAITFYLFAATVFASAKVENRDSHDQSLFSAAQYLEWVGYLADDAREGRGLGQPGIARSEEYIASVFESLGVQPAGDNGGYFQNFTLELGVGIRDETHLAVGVQGRRIRRPAELGKDYIPFPYSTNGTFKGQVVFAGYGIVNETAGYNDYAGIDIAGKIVLVLRGSPDFGDFGPSDTALQAKTQRAKERNAKAIMIVNRDGNAQLYDFEIGGQRQKRYGLPMLHVTPATADAMLTSAELPSIAELQSRIESSESPASSPIAGVTVRGFVSIGPEETPVRNVVGLIPGQGPQADEIIVIGAHHDHLGVRNKSKADFAADKDIFNGADDNASGAAMVLELAKVFTQGDPPNRSILLITFTAEEIGLLGSQHFVNNPTIDLGQCVAMFNFDMVGRIQDNRVEVGGMRTGEFEEVVHRIADKYDLDVVDGGGGFGPSDHIHFYRHSIPVLFFFTGLHKQYHRPADDTHRIDPEGAMLIAQLATDIIRFIDAQSQPPTFSSDRRQATLMRQKSRKDQDARQQRRPTKTARKQKRVRLGIRPATDDQPGVLVDNVSNDSPAMRAGLRKGDRIVRLAGVPIRTLDQLLHELAAIKDGDETTILVVRNGYGEAFAIEFNQGRTGKRASAGQMAIVEIKSSVLGKLDSMKRRHDGGINSIMMRASERHEYWELHLTLDFDPNKCAPAEELIAAVGKSISQSTERFQYLIEIDAVLLKPTKNVIEMKIEIKR